VLAGLVGGAGTAADITPSTVRGSSADLPSQADAVHRWAAEKSLYDAKPEPAANAGQPWGHWSQIVWRDSKRVGCGEANAPKRDAMGTDTGLTRSVIVCRYDPPGNRVGQYPC
jgi:pathogenesis-related protein 1